MKIWSINQIDESVLTTFSENANFPVTNLQNFIPSKVYKTTGDSTIEEVYFDLGTAQLVTSIIIYNHNFDGTETLLRIQGSDTSGFLTEPVSEDLTVSTVINKNFTGGTYRYWRLQFHKAVSTDIRSIGKIYLGTSTDLGEADFDGGYFLTAIDPSKSSKSIGGQTYTERKEKFRTVDLSFSKRTNAIKEAFEAIYDEVGTWHPVYIQVMDTAPLDEILYVRITEKQSYKISSWDNEPFWNLSLSVEEQI